MARPISWHISAHTLHLKLVQVCQLEIHIVGKLCHQHCQMKLGAFIAVVRSPLHSLCFSFTETWICYPISGKRSDKKKWKIQFSRNFVLSGMIPCTWWQTIVLVSFQDLFESIFLIMHQPFRQRLSYPVSITCLYLCQSATANTKDCTRYALGSRVKHLLDSLSQ